MTEYQDPDQSSTRLIPCDFCECWFTVEVMAVHVAVAHPDD